MPKINVVLLASRSGQNASWIIKAAHTGKFPFQVSLVIWNGPGTYPHAHFNQCHVPIIAVDSNNFASRAFFEQHILEMLADFGNPLVVSCSFNRLLSSHFLDSYPNYAINSHPSLLPAFPGRPAGLKPVDAALHYGVKLVGATVHFIDAGMDTGPIIMQGAIPWHSDEKSQVLIAKVLKLEALLKISTLCYFGEDCVMWIKGSRQVTINYTCEREERDVCRQRNMLISPPPVHISTILPILDGDES